MSVSIHSTRKDTYIGRKVYISRITIDARSGLADSRVLVPNRDIIGRRCRLEVARLLGQVQMLAALMPVFLRNRLNVEREEDRQCQHGRDH